MKKIMLNLCAVICTAAVMTVAIEATTGCKSVPTNDTMYTTSYAIGIAAGLITNETKIDDASRNAVCEIMGIVRYCVPETNETFMVAWMTKATDHVTQLIEAGKLTAAQGKMVLTAFSLACQGLDYIFEVRYPSAKVYKDLVVAAIDGFCDGFLTVFKPVNVSETRSSCTAQYYDAEAYNWLKANRKIK